MAKPSRLSTQFFLQSLLVIFLFGLGWRVLSLGLADATSRLSPQKALEWRQRHPIALFLLAEQQAKIPALLQQAKQNAFAALRAYPLEGRAYRVLGQLSEAEKKPQAAFELYKKAVHYSPRDVQSHLWLLNYALRTENAATAVAHLDIMLRLQPNLEQQLQPMIGGLAVHPISQASLINVLKEKPPWRSSAINNLLSQPEAAERYGLFFNRLTAATAGGLIEAEQQAWTRALNLSQQWSLSYLNWASQLPAATQLKLGNLFNGSFEDEPLGGEFDWIFESTPGASIDRAYRDGAVGEMALRVSFDDRRVPFSGVRQTLVLPPGHYRLSGQGLPENLRTEVGLVWAVECSGGNVSLGISEPFKGSSREWQAFSVEFVILIDQCPAQWLRLKLPARVESEQAIGGRIWFDALRIQRIAPNTRIPN